MLGLCPQIECGQPHARPSVTRIGPHGAIAGRMAPSVQATEKAEYASLFRRTSYTHFRYIRSIEGPQKIVIVGSCKFCLPLSRQCSTPLRFGVSEVADALGGQQGQVRVAARENTGPGFYTTLDVPRGSPIKGVASPLGDVFATVVGLQHGMGFLLWLRDGHIHQLEGYSYEESTSGLDFERVAFVIQK